MINYRHIQPKCRHILTKIQTHFDKNWNILRHGVKIIFLRDLFLSQKMSEFLSNVSEFVWKELPQKGKKSFWESTFVLMTNMEKNEGSIFVINPLAVLRGLLNWGTTSFSSIWVIKTELDCLTSLCDSNLLIYYYIEVTMLVYLFIYLSVMPTPHTVLCVQISKFACLMVTIFLTS